MILYLHKKGYAMDKYELEGEIGDTYRSLTNYLVKKYGPVKYDYFLDESCKTVNKKNSRTNEGLQIHHKDENKAIMLSDPEFAIGNPYKYQKADRLVYCNILEHLILHLKITEDDAFKIKRSNTICGLGGAINFLIPEINSYYAGKLPANPTKYSVLDENFDSYIMILMDFYYLGFECYWLGKKLSKEKLSRDLDGKIVDKVYSSLNE